MFRSIRHHNCGAIGLLVLCSVVLFFGPTDNWRWDPSFYYAQLRSPIIDHDFDLRGEIQPADEIPQRTVTGLVPSVWPLGVSIAWSPFFLAAHAYKLVTSSEQAADGLSPVYIAAVAAGSALYGLLGVLIIYRICRLFAGHGLALLVAALVLMATPLFYYVYRQPLMGHTTGLVAAALLLYVVIQLQRERIPFEYSGLLTGAFVGLNAATRWIGTTAVVLPAILFVLYIVAALRERDWRRVRAVIGQCAIAAQVAALMLTPQMVLWRRLYNIWFLVPVPRQMFTTRTSVLPPYLPHLFIHTNRGLLYWAPFFILGMIGLFRVRPISLRWMCLAYVAGTCFVLGSFITWHGGGGFGARYFNETTPVLAVGFVCLFRDLWSLGWGRLVIGVLGVTLVMHQLLLVTIVEQAWQPLPAYFGGESLGLQYQLDGLQRLVQRPADMFLPRPGIAAPRQAAIVNLRAGVRDWAVYLTPLVACLIIITGMVAYRFVARLRFLPAMAMLMVAYMVGWCCFLLIAT